VRLCVGVVCDSLSLMSWRSSFFLMEVKILRRNSYDTGRKDEKEKESALSSFDSFVWFVMIDIKQ
jgi:hypothetical protein